jgi:hypothetical protein
MPGVIGIGALTIDGDTLRVRSAGQTLLHLGDRRLVSVVTFRRA